MKKSEMLRNLISHYTNGNQAKFASMLGVNAQNISAWIARDTFDAELLFSKCDGVSAEWLLSNGEGEMLSKDKHIVDVSINVELIQLCKQLVSNYQQREEVMSKLVSLMK